MELPADIVDLSDSGVEPLTEYPYKSNDSPELEGR